MRARLVHPRMQNNECLRERYLLLNRRYTIVDRAPHYEVIKGFSYHTVAVRITNRRIWISTNKQLRAGPTV